MKGEIHCRILSRDQAAVYTVVNFTVINSQSPLYQETTNSR